MVPERTCERQSTVIFNLDKVKLGEKKDLHETIGHFFCQKYAKRIAMQGKVCLHILEIQYLVEVFTTARSFSLFW